MAVKWGILSTADINRKLLAGAAESDDVEVVAVGSRDLARAEEFAQTWGIRRAYGSYEELLADPEVEAVYIPLPNTMHSEWSIKARRGRQARALREAVQQAHRGRRACLRRGGGDRDAPLGGLHVPPPPADRTARRARRGRRDRRAARDPLARSATRSTTPTTSACARTSRAAR